MKVKKTNAEWQQILPTDVYHVTREKGTERAFSGKYDKFFVPGKYLCSNCNHELFVSDTKFDAGCGWPSFYDTASQESISLQKDPGSGLMEDRTEVICQNCGSHLGHVFNDGPSPTGLRYCMNSLALNFDPQEK